ncbi:MAG: ABC transporter, ATP-binding protein, partial [uncultured Gemmatimonadetes bacterium]
GTADPRRLQDLRERCPGAEARQPDHPHGHVRPAGAQRRRQVDAHAHAGHTAGAGHRHHPPGRHRRGAPARRAAPDAGVPAAGVRRVSQGERRRPAG